MPDKKIHVWQDITSEGRDNAKWIVSLEEGDSSKTLSVHESEFFAWLAGADQAKRMGCRLFRLDSEGNPHESEIVEI